MWLVGEHGARAGVVLGCLVVLYRARAACCLLSKDSGLSTDVSFVVMEGFGSARHLRTSRESDYP